MTNSDPNDTQGSSEPTPAATPTPDTPQPQTAEEGLPEFEPMSPELAEDEAIRGDFMLRWAVILLALLFGFTQIQHAQTLVHIRAGEYLVSHGVLPPAEDVLSYTATEQPWVQLDWLFNLIAAAVYSLTSAWGLTLIKALLAAGTVALVVHNSQEGVSTWWGSLCAAILVLATFRQFTFRPELITLFGLSLTLYWLHRWRSADDASVRWKLPVWFLIWSNLDPRMFFGLTAVLLFSIGHALTPKSKESPPRFATAGSAWTLVACCVLASLINPFGWNSLTSAYSLFETEYPILREYEPVVIEAAPHPDKLMAYSPLSEEFRAWLNVSAIATGLLVLLAVLGWTINSKRLDLAEMLATLGVFGLAIPAAHGLGPVAVAATVSATLNFQQWYQRTFRQTYTADTKELLYSRLGRAATVLAFVACALWLITGKLDERGGSRIGAGFHPELAGQIAGTLKNVEEAFDDRPFNFRLEQGDLMIWAGQRSFVDHRVHIFAQPTDEPIYQRHQQTRKALRAPNPNIEGTGRPDLWAATFDEYQVSHVVPRLFGDSPDYRTYLDLVFSPEWQLTQISSAGAVFYRLDDPDLPGIAEYVEENSFNIVVDAFRPEEERLYERLDWGRPPTFYQRHLMPPRIKSNDTRLAQHLLETVKVVPFDQFGVTTALTHRAIQHANAALAENPQDALAYESLGVAYTHLGQTEAAILETSNPPITPMRYFQALQAFHQALVIDPELLQAHDGLRNLYAMYRQIDLQLRQIDEILRIRRAEPTLSQEEFELLGQLQQISDNLLTQSEQVQQNIDQQLSEAGENLDAQTVSQLAAVAYSNNCPELALKILDDHLELIQSSLESLLLRGTLMIEVGRVEEAYEVLGQMEAVTEERDFPPYYFPAAVSALGFGEYVRANSVLQEELRSRRAAQADYMNAVGAARLVMTLPMMQDPFRQRWPLVQLGVVDQLVTELPGELAESKLRIAQINLEIGRTERAAEILREILELAPESRVRPLARLYLAVTTDEIIEALPDYGWRPADDATLDQLPAQLPAAVDDNR